MIKMDGVNNTKLCGNLNVLNFRPALSIPKQKAAVLDIFLYVLQSDSFWQNSKQEVSGQWDACPPEN
jgi:hypothetical protein